MNLADLRGQRVLIWGYGRHGGGAAAARFCADHGALVTILDAKPIETFGALADPARAAGWPWLVGDGSHPALADCQLIVASPAIPPRAWPTRHAPVTSPEALFCATHRGPRVAVTGTKGKSTTARILGTLLGWEVAGNSYDPLLDMLAQVGRDAPLVCELSSFQLQGLSTSSVQIAGANAFRAAIITSLAVDHLDWHPNLDHYHRAKLGVGGLSEAIAAAPEAVTRAHDLGIALPTTIAPVRYEAERFLRANGDCVATRTDLPVLGDHNAHNAALAIAVALHLGLDPALVAPRLRQVRPLPHRLETVHTAGGLRFINDSIATTPEAAIAGIAACSGPLAVILGGSDKGARWDQLAAAIAKRHETTAIQLIGQTGPAIAAALAHAGINAPHHATLHEAVRHAVAALPSGGTVLLSPACASFDMFQGFDDRGRQFAAAAHQLAPAENAR